MEASLLPQRAAHPTHIRLDGAKTGGNRELAGGFRHHNQVWKVHADTHYDPLVRAYEAMQKDKSYDPFIEELTPNGTCLVLTEALRRASGSEYKYLYIYQE